MSGLTNIGLKMPSSDKYCVVFSWFGCFVSWWKIYQPCTPWIFYCG